jgi:hypothetical protein
VSDYVEVRPHRWGPAQAQPKEFGDIPWRFHRTRVKAV